MTDAPFDPYALYRYFDVQDLLLYVGISGDLAVRDKSHIASSKWMQFTARSTVERHETLGDIKAAERAAIEGEHPIFNKTYNNTPEAKERLRAYLERAGRLDLLPPPRPPRPESDPAPTRRGEARLKCMHADEPCYIPGPFGCMGETGPGYPCPHTPAGRQLTRLKCVGADGSRPWVPGFRSFPEAHIWCPPGACLGRLTGTPEEIWQQVAAAIGLDPMNPLRASVTGDEARTLITSAAADLRRGA